MGNWRSFGRKARPTAAKTISTRQGDTLRSIAQREFGDESKWMVIYEANKWRIASPDFMEPGFDLLIPLNGRPPS